MHAVGERKYLFLSNSTWVQLMSKPPITAKHPGGLGPSLTAANFGTGEPVKGRVKL